MKEYVLIFGCLLVMASCSTSQRVIEETMAEEKIEVLQLDWDELSKTEPYKLTEQWEPVPTKVTPGYFTAPPSDAVVLFNGTDLSGWHHPEHGYGARMDQVESILNARTKAPKYSDAEWLVKDGAMIVKPGSGDLETKQNFGDMQLHIEWLSPYDPGKEDQYYSNSGIFFMGLYEIQVLNSYENSTYANGQAGALYKQHIPLVNASRPPGEWQSYDIVFNAPTFDASGELTKAATVTAFHNGVLIQNNAELEGPCVFIGKSHYIQHADKLPLILQDHGDQVRFRNIWVREL